MASERPVGGSTVTASCRAFRYVLPLVSVTVMTSLDALVRRTTAIQFPAVFGDAKPSELVRTAPPSFAVCCTSTIGDGAEPPEAVPTVMPTAAEVVFAPRLSVATACSAYVPAATLFHVMLYGAAVAVPINSEPE